MKAFKRLSFSLNNWQPLTLLTTPYPAPFQSNSNWTFFIFLQNFDQSPAGPILSGSPCSDSPTNSSQGCHQKQDSWTAVCLLPKKKWIKNKEGQILEEEWTWVFCGFMHFVASYSAIHCPIWSCRLQYAVLCLRLHIESSLLTWFFNLTLPAVCCDWIEAEFQRISYCMQD